jgi:hypothetical protein
MRSTRVPFPCAVYSRRSSAGPFVYSHHVKNHVVKLFPASMRVSDLREFRQQSNWEEICKTCFLVLVSGDLARLRVGCISLHSSRDIQRIAVQFFYPGSSFAKSEPYAHPTDLEPGVIPLHFHGTVAVYHSPSALSTIIPVESSLVLFPHQLNERDVQKLATTVSNAAQRSLQSSVWVTETGESYNESTTRLRHTRKAYHALMQGGCLKQAPSETRHRRTSHRLTPY